MLYVDLFESQAIALFAYDLEASSLLIRFKTGEVYVYQDGAARGLRRFREAPSKGQFFQTAIRDRFAARRLSPSEVAAVERLHARGAASGIAGHRSRRHRRAERPWKARDIFLKWKIDSCPGPPIRLRRGQRRQHVAVCVNQARLLAGLRYAFTERHAVVTEFCKTRAGPTPPWLPSTTMPARAAAHRARRRGRDRRLAEPVHRSVRPAGMRPARGPSTPPAWVSCTCLYAATRCTVRSRGAMIAFDTAAALRQQPIAVQPAPCSAQTVVMLEGVVLPELDRRVALLARAFPIAVIYNGRRAAAASGPRCQALRGHSDRAGSPGRR